MREGVSRIEENLMIGNRFGLLVADANWSVYQGIFPAAERWCGEMDDDALRAEQESNLKARILTADAKSALEIIKEVIQHAVRIVQITTTDEPTRTWRHKDQGNPKDRARQRADRQHPTPGARRRKAVIDPISQHNAC